MTTLEYGLGGAILFYSGVLFCLPVPPTEEIAAMYPWWGKRIALGNILLYELLFVVWMAAIGARFLLGALSVRRFPSRQAALWLMALGVWTGLLSITAPLPVLDVGRAARLVLNAIMMLAIVRWARRSGSFPLGMLLSGFLVGTIINLVLSVRYPLIVLETMRLSGQNTPGVAMGIAIHLCAWLFLCSKTHGARIFAVAATLTFAFGCAISYSRIGWFAGALGVAAWGYVLLFVRPRAERERRQLNRMRAVLLPMLVLGLVVALRSEVGREGVTWVQTLATQKFADRGESDSIRYTYLIGTMEILARHPFGVGYSGFFDAILATDTYRLGTAAQEESIQEANPHASFLWYATAGGIPGVTIALLVFVLLLNSLRVGLAGKFGHSGVHLFLLVALPYMVIGMTVPYLLNSIILIAPTAIAAGWGWAERTRLQSG